MAKQKLFNYFCYSIFTCLQHFAFPPFDQDIFSQDFPSFRNQSQLEQSRSINAFKDKFTNMWNSKIDNFVHYELKNNFQKRALLLTLIMLVTLRHSNRSNVLPDDLPSITPKQFQKCRPSIFNLQYYGAKTLDDLLGPKRTKLAKNDMIYWVQIGFKWLKCVKISLNWC